MLYDERDFYAAWCCVVVACFVRKNSINLIARFILRANYFRFSLGGIYTRIYFVNLLKIAHGNICMFSIDGLIKKNQLLNAFILFFFFIKHAD